MLVLPLSLVSVIFGVETALGSLAAIQMGEPGGLQPDMGRLDGIILKEELETACNLDVPSGVELLDVVGGSRQLLVNGSRGDLTQRDSKHRGVKVISL